MSLFEKSLQVLIHSLPFDKLEGLHNVILGEFEKRKKEYKLNVMLEMYIFLRKHNIIKEGDFSGLCVSIYLRAFNAEMKFTINDKEYICNLNVDLCCYNSKSGTAFKECPYVILPFVDITIINRNTFKYYVNECIGIHYLYKCFVELFTIVPSVLEHIKLVVNSTNIKKPIDGS